ncbi:M3 family metallopeptidase [Oligella urethralis]|uniref:M3 family metallopeptidase n=1 Tax=Oligella urethralis TaxID=90245 RepID=UPI000E057991|nr:M3 family metallopeptidase [Oligella urethralis]SUA58567.1 Oligopeptidase A [Oligella urethralis]
MTEQLSNNPLLTPLEQLMPYEAIEPEHIVPAIEFLLKEAKALIEQLITVAEPNWDNFIEPMEYGTAGLWRAWNVVNHLNNVHNTDAVRSAYNTLLPQVSEFSTWIGLNKALFEQYQTLHQSEAFQVLSKTRQRIITEALKDFELSGVSLEGEAKTRYAEMCEQLAMTSQQFALNALDATDKWSYHIKDAEEVAGIPEQVLAAANDLAGGKGWTFTLKMPSYLPVMQYASNQALRQRMYQGYATIASEQGDKQFDNSDNIETLLKLRLELAKLLGFKDFATMQLEKRMADSPQQVIDFIRDLAAKAKPFAEKDMAELSAFARQELGMAALEPWDLAYVSERLREKKFAYSDEEVKQYLPEDQVLNGLFTIIEQLFKVKFEVTEAQTWHQDAKVFALKEADQLIGYLYTDLHARNAKQSGAWVANERTRQHHQGELITPVVYLTCNFTPPQGAKAGLLRLDDVVTLFHEMGHALHALLSKVDEPSASPFASVEWDAIELPSQFMENFCYEWPVMQKLSRHQESGKPLPRQLFNKIIAAKNFQTGMQTVRQLEFALFDMLLHQQLEQQTIADVLTLLDEVREEVAVVMPPSWHRFPHNFSHIFAGGYAAGYYSYKWAEVLSADAYSYFEEHATEEFGTLNPQAGEHFKNEILAVGGSLPATEFFEKFRGRPADPAALLRHHGMVDEQS